MSLFWKRRYVLPFVTLAYAGGSLVTPTAAMATDVTATQGDGNIPGTYQQLDFYVRDGNWAQNLALPSTASKGSMITIHEEATYPTDLSTGNTDLGPAPPAFETGRQDYFHLPVITVSVDPYGTNGLPLHERWQRHHTRHRRTKSSEVYDRRRRLGA